MTVPANEWAAKVLHGDVRAISRAITAIENHSPEAEQLLKQLFPHTGKPISPGLPERPAQAKVHWWIASLPSTANAMSVSVS